ncbi:MAG: hypothetical protein U9O96_07070 [Candidatus Thermoplasmatota archaeon]|nr:hypothetical protein [Candidatus Thermoplasmatota archaeon]
MKKFAKTLLAIFSIALLIPFIPSDNNTEKKADTFGECMGNMHASLSDEYFIPENMTLKDDSFHSDLPLHIETWYYEAIFNNNYSMIFIVTLFSSDGKSGTALAGLYIYKEGHMEVMERATAFSFYASNEGPFIKFFGDEVVNGYIDKYNRLSYDISFEKNENGIELQFINKTRGWKGEMGMGWWLAIPELHVTGKMKIGGKVTSVEGKGYHDHNIFSLFTPVVEWGYMDGKVTCDSFSLVWGDIMHNRRYSDIFAILSENGSYMAVLPESIEMRFYSYIYDHGRKIPTESFISIDDTKNSIFVELHMTTIDFHHIRLPFIHYWRYHVKVEGIIRTAFREEIVDEICIMERMLY